MLKFFSRCIVSIIFLTSPSYLLANNIELLETLLTQTGGTWSAIADDNTEYRLVFTAPSSTGNVGTLTITRDTQTIPPTTTSGSWRIVKVPNRTKYLIRTTIPIPGVPIPSPQPVNYSLEIRTLGEIRLTFKDLITGVYYRFFKVALPTT